MKKSIKTIIIIAFAGIVSLLLIFGFAVKKATIVELSSPALDIAMEMQTTQRLEFTVAVEFGNEKVDVPFGIVNDDMDRHIVKLLEENTAVWVSGNEDVVSVNSDGTVTAVGVGQSEITLTFGDKTLVYTVSTGIAVENVQVFDLKTDDALTENLHEENAVPVTELAVPVDGSVFLGYVINPADATDATLTFASSDEEILQVDEAGIVTGIAPGEAQLMVTASSPFGKPIEITVPVKVSVFPTHITIMESEEQLWVGDVLMLNVAVEPEDAIDYSVLWSSSDETIVTVDNEGNVTAVGVGTAVVSVTIDGSSLSAACEITVTSYEDRSSNVPSNTSAGSTSGGSGQSSGATGSSSSPGGTYSSIEDAFRDIADNLVGEAYLDENGNFTTKPTIDYETIKARCIRFESEAAAEQYCTENGIKSHTIWYIDGACYLEIL